MYTPVNPFYCIKVGFKGVKIIYVCFRDAHCLPLIQKFTDTSTGSEKDICKDNLYRQTIANSVDPDKTPHNAASDQGLSFLPLTQQY